MTLSSADTSSEKKKCSEGPTENNSEDLGVPSKIIKMLESHNFGFSIVLPVRLFLNQVFWGPGFSKYPFQNLPDVPPFLTKYLYFVQ